MSKVLHGECLDGEMKGEVKLLVLKANLIPLLLNDQVRLNCAGSYHARQHQSCQMMVEAQIQFRLLLALQVAKALMIRFDSM